MDPQLPNGEAELKVQRPKTFAQIALETMQADQPGLSPITANLPCQAGWIMDDGKAYTQYEWPCHAFLSRPGQEYFYDDDRGLGRYTRAPAGSKPQVYYNFWGVNKKYTENDEDYVKAEEAFCKWICGRTHPWAKVLGLDKRKRIGDVDISTVPFRRKLGFIFTDLTAFAARELANFCFATRFAVEYRAEVKLWHKLVTEHKIDPALAYFWCHLMKVSGSNVSFVACDGGHQPFECYTATVEYVNNLVLGKLPPRKDKPYAQAYAYYGANHIWGHNTRGETYQAFLREMYGDKLRGGKGKAPVFARDVDSYTLNGCIEVMKLEQERIKALGA